MNPVTIEEWIRQRNKSISNSSTIWKALVKAGKLDGLEHRQWAKKHEGSQWTKHKSLCGPLDSK